MATLPDAAAFSSCLRGAQSGAAPWIAMGSHPTHTYCDEVLVMPSLRAVYVANQKAASRTIRTMFKELDPRSINILLPYAGYQKRCGARAASGLPPAFSNFTVFTFVRRPLDAFVSGFAETMGRVLHQPSKAEWGGGRAAPHYFGLGCSEANRYFTTFVEDAKARRPLGLPTFHVFPQAVKVGVFLGADRDYDFVGRVEQFEEHMLMLLERLNVANARERLAALLIQKNPADTNLDRCDAPIRPAAKEFTQELKGALCTLMASDFTCLGEYYGSCASNAASNASRDQSASCRRTRPLLCSRRRGGP